jgi:hypothetical protein
MKFFDSVFWEFVQNVPVIVLFIIAVWLWARTRKAYAVACALCGAAVGSLLARFTEPATNGTYEPIAVTIVNVASLSLLQILLAAYLGTEANWSNRKTDLLLGAMTGVSLAVAQGLVSQGLSLVCMTGRGVALAAVGGLVLLGIRKLKNETLVSALANGALLAVAATLFVSAMDHGYFPWG